MPFSKNHISTLILLPLLCILFSGRVFAEGYPAYAPEDMPNVQLSDSRRFVSDPMGLLSQEATGRIDNTIAGMRRKTTAEMAVAIVPDLGDIDIESYAEKLFTDWGIGKDDRDNGILLMISPGSRKARIQTGYGVEGILPDMVCDRIIRKDIVPAMRNGDLDLAATSATASICKALEDPAYADELRSSQEESASDSIDSKALRAAFLGVLALIATGGFCGSIYLFFSTRRRLKQASRYRKALEWRRQLPKLGVSALLSAFTALPLLIIALLHYRLNRNRAIRCHRCGTKMKKLDEKTDNLYLDPSQDLEERLGSVDYDVWLCPECGEVEKYPYNEHKSAYKKCPSCGTFAYHVVCDRIERHPTPMRAGLGTKVWHCEYCGHDHDDHYQIPREEYSGAIPAAKGAIGAGLIGGILGSGGGGGSFGGGFGGGSTGGGGASGGW